MSVIDKYLETLTPPQKEALQRLREIVQHLAPDAEEAISYGIPAFKYKGKYLVGFSAFKDHLSLFPGASPIAALKDKLKDYTLAKGTIQFTFDHQLPEEIVKEIVLHRMAEISNGQS